MPSASPFHALTDPDTLAAWLDRSHREPVLIFKHSLTCGTSAAAYEEIAHYLSATPAPPACGMVVVQTHRQVSNEVAATLGVTHHTPQLLLVANGVAGWHVSHWRITVAAIRDAVAAASAVVA